MIEHNPLIPTLESGLFYGFGKQIREIFTMRVVFKREMPYNEISKREEVLFMDLENLSVEDLVLGYQILDSGYECLFCGERFEEGEIFPIEGRFFEARRAVMLHVEKEHDKLEAFLGSKYSAVTENQAQLLRLFRSGKSDKEIASSLEVSPSTVRHQRFTFREKAKQAKLYLAIYEEAMTEKPRSEEVLVPIHEHATQVDERYHITEKEREDTLKSTLQSYEPLVLKVFPKKEKRKIILLMEIAKQFERGRTYSEAEVNAVLKEIYGDFVTVRRYLIQYGFMVRTDDGKEYRLT